jgi:CHAT domain-containing protein
VFETVPQGLIIPLDYSDDALLNREMGGIAVSTVLKCLSSLPVTILHIASHGQQDTSDPVNSGFLLRDNKLTLLKLMQCQLGQDSFLAFLSACESAKSSSDIAHESVHLAATMLFVGFKSVVGTMW